MGVRRENNSAQVLAALKEIASVEVRIGFFEHSKYPDGTPVAYVAAIQELGYGPIPPRPFMRPAESGNKAKWQQNFASLMRAVINGQMSAISAMEQLGMVAAGDVRKAIRAVTAPPLKASTIAARQRRKKGKKSVSTKPLVDTGLMLQSVTSVVVEKGK